MDLLDTYDDSIPGLQFSHMCYTTYPCKHTVIKNGHKKLVGALEIYQYCVDNNYAIPGHFQDYKKYFEALKKAEEIQPYFDLIKDNDFEGFKDNKYLESTKSSFLRTACKYNNMQFIKYLVEDVDTPITLQHVTEVVGSDKYNFTVFKYVIDKSNVYDIDILSKAIEHNHFSAVSYLIGEKKMSIVVPENHTKLLIQSFATKNQEMIDYLVRKSIETNIIFSGNDVGNLKRNGLFDIFVKLDLIYNPNAKVMVMLIGLSDAEDDEITLHWENLLLEHLQEQLEDVIFSRLKSDGRITLGQMDVEKFSFKGIKFCLSLPNQIKNVYFDFNGSKKYFNKKINNDYVEFEFTSQDPLYMYYTPFTTKSIIFETNKEDQMINKIICTLELDKSTYEYKAGEYQNYTVNDETKCVVSDGMMQFMDNKEFAQFAKSVLVK